MSIPPPPTPYPPSFTKLNVFIISAPVTFEASHFKPILSAINCHWAPPLKIPKSLMSLLGSKTKSQRHYTFFSVKTAILGQFWPHNS